MSSERSLPSDFIKSIYGKPVVVKFFSGVVYKGMIDCLSFYNRYIELFRWFSEHCSRAS